MNTFVINLPDPDEVRNKIEHNREVEQETRDKQKAAFKEHVYEHIRKYVVPEIERVARAMNKGSNTTSAYSLTTPYFNLDGYNSCLAVWNRDLIFKEAVRDFVQSFNKDQVNRGSGARFVLQNNEKYSQPFLSTEGDKSEQKIGYHLVLYIGF